MAVDLIARALALKAAGGGSGGSGFAKEADFNAPGFMPEENTYYIYKDSGIEPVIEYKPFVVGEILPSGSLIHIHPDKQDELAAFIDGLTDGQAGFFVVLGTKPNGGIMFQHLAAGEGVTADANIMVYTDIVSQKLTPIYSSAETDINESGLQIHITKGFQNLDSDNNFVLNYGDDEWSITMLSYGPDPSIFDNLDWNGKMISWAEAQTGSKYQDGIVYLYQDGQYHEIGPQGTGDDAPILNADFYAKDFTPQNGRFYRQVGTSKYIGPIEHEQGANHLVFYFDISASIEDMVYELEGLERDQVPPASTSSGGAKIWWMASENSSGGGLSSMSILWVPANTEGFMCDKDFWIVGVFGGMIPFWCSETFQLQPDPSQQARTINAGWQNHKYFQDNKIDFGTTNMWVFNTQYYDAFTSTEPIKEAAKNTIAKYINNKFNAVSLQPDTDFDASSKNAIANDIVTNNCLRMFSHSITLSQLGDFINWLTYEHNGILHTMEFYTQNGVDFDRDSERHFRIFNPSFEWSYGYTYVASCTYLKTRFSSSTPAYKIIPYYVVIYGNQSFVTTELTGDTLGDPFESDSDIQVRYYATKQYGSNNG